MVITTKNLIINIFVKVDDFYKSIISLIHKRFVEYNNNYSNKKKKNLKHRIDILSESEIIINTRIKNVFNYFSLSAKK